MPVKNPDCERNCRLQQGSPTQPSSFSVPCAAQSDFLTAIHQGHFHSYFVGICSNAGFEGLHPHFTEGGEDDRIPKV